jgi:hypothetical protein
MIIIAEVSEPSLSVSEGLTINERMHCKKLLATLPPSAFYP